jgi:hypothetical protein
MATGDNALIPLFEEGDRPTVAVTAAIGSGKFVKPATGFQGGPLLDLSGPTTPLTKGNLMQAALCGAGQRAFGVLAWDTTAADDVAPMIATPTGMIIPMTAGATITAGQEVQSDASGNPIPWDGTLASVRNGLAVSGAANGATVYIQLR